MPRTTPWFTAEKKEEKTLDVLCEEEWKIADILDPL
jgi:hypothetical protein